MYGGADGGFAGDYGDGGAGGAMQHYNAQNAQIQPGFGFDQEGYGAGGGAGGGFRPRHDSTHTEGAFLLHAVFNDLVGL